MVTVSSAITAEGNPTFQQTTYKHDGKDYPRYSQVSLPDFSAKGLKPATDAYRTVDAYTSERPLAVVGDSIRSPGLLSIYKDSRLCRR